MLISDGVQPLGGVRKVRGG